MGKGEIARYEQFLLFPQCFQKACFPGASKGVNVWEWVKKYKKYKNWTDFLLANWVQNKGSLSMFCTAPRGFIRRNMVYVTLSKNEKKKNLRLVKIESIYWQQPKCDVNDDFNLWKVLKHFRKLRAKVALGHSPEFLRGPYQFFFFGGGGKGGGLVQSRRILMNFLMSAPIHKSHVL